MAHSRVDIDLSTFGPPDIHANEYECKRILASGSNGIVWEGECRGASVAIKKLKKQVLSSGDLAAFKKEMELCSKLAHPNILLFMGACTEQGDIAIITELCEKGNLEDILHNKNASLTPTRRLIMAKEIATGMAWLHGSDPQIIHRDLKPANILIDGDGHVKICDFGLSSLKPSSANIRDGDKIPGSLLWMAPEVLKGGELSEKIDIYSYGIVLWEIVTQKFPFEGYVSPKQFCRDIWDNVRPPLDEIEDDSICKLLQRCWDSNPDKRPNFQEIILAIDYVLIHCAIHSDEGRDFWLEKFFGRINIPFTEFCDELSDYLGLTVPGECVAFLKLILSSEYSDGIMRSVSMVNMEDFGNFLMSYGPMEFFDVEHNEMNIFERVLSICTKQWFHGNITKIQAEERLRYPGDFLVRTSSKPGFFCISGQDKERVFHIRIDYRENDGCYVNLNSTDVKIGKELVDAIENMVHKLGLIRVAQGLTCNSIVSGCTTVNGFYENDYDVNFLRDSQ